MKKYKLDEYDVGIIVNALIEFRNSLIQADKHTDAVDELILKFYGDK